MDAEWWKIKICGASGLWNTGIFRGVAPLQRHRISVPFPIPCLMNLFHLAVPELCPITINWWFGLAYWNLVMIFRYYSKDLELFQAEHSILKIEQQINSAAIHCITMFVKHDSAFRYHLTVAQGGGGMVFKLANFIVPFDCQDYAVVLRKYPGKICNISVKHPQEMKTYSVSLDSLFFCNE